MVQMLLEFNRPMITAGKDPDMACPTKLTFALSVAKIAAVRATVSISSWRSHAVVIDPKF